MWYYLSYLLQSALGYFQWFHSWNERWGYIHPTQRVEQVTTSCCRSILIIDDGEQVDENNNLESSQDAETCPRPYSGQKEKLLLKICLFA